MRIRATGGWSFEIGSEFNVVNNGDSVQAVHGDRVVYVSSLSVGSSEMPAPTAQLRSVAAGRLGSGERVSHDGPAVQGDAEISQSGDTWQLKGTMCSAGTLATCMIDFTDPGERAWAISVWRSLQFDQYSVR